MISTLRTALLLTALGAAATALVGWWGLPIVTGVWTVALPRRGSIVAAVLAGAAAWAILLAVAARSGHVGEMATLLGEILGTTGGAVIVLTLTFGALLAGSAALLARGINPPVAR
jgi:spore maturation protein SpmB